MQISSVTEQVGRLTSSVVERGGIMAERTEREADVETVAATDTESGSSLIPKVFNRLNELSVVKSMCEQVSGVYERTRERNRATQLGLGAAEVSVKTALHTTRLVYSALPSTGFTGKLKEELEEKGKPVWFVLTVFSFTFKET